MSLSAGAILGIAGAVMGGANSLKSTGLGISQEIRDWKRLDQDKILAREQMANQTAIAQMQDNRERYLAENEYRLKVEDLERAGLNPALALGGISTGTAVSNTALGAGNDVAQSDSSAKLALAGMVKTGLSYKSKTRQNIKKISQVNAKNASKLLKS